MPTARATSQPAGRAGADCTAPRVAFCETPLVNETANCNVLSSEDDVAILTSLTQRFARNPLSVLLLCENSWKIFHGTSVDGAICYFEAFRTAVVWSDPLCAEQDTEALLLEFRTHMKARGWTVCFLAIQERTAVASLQQGSAVLKVGEEPVFNLRTWQRPRGDRGKRLRWSLNKAAKAGIVVSRYIPAQGRQPLIESEICTVVVKWQQGLGREATTSILRTAPLEQAERKQIFLARRGGRVEAVLSCSPIYGRNGWYLEDLIRLPTAAEGATELLTVAALEALAADGYAFATLGIAPLRGFDQQLDGRARWLASALRLVFDRLDNRFHFKALSTYKSKFEPSGWEPAFVAIQPAWPTLRLIRAVLAVLENSPPKQRPGISSVTRLPILARAGAFGLTGLIAWNTMVLHRSPAATVIAISAAVLLWVVGGLLPKV